MRISSYGLSSNIYRSYLSAKHFFVLRGYSLPISRHLGLLMQIQVSLKHRRSQDFQFGGLKLKKSYTTAGTDPKNFGGGMQI